MLESRMMSTGAAYNALAPASCSSGAVTVKDGREVTTNLLTEPAAFRSQRRTHSERHCLSVLAMLEGTT